MSDWAREIPAPGSSTAMVATFRDSLATAGKSELCGFLPAGIEHAARGRDWRHSGHPCAAISTSWPLDPVCRVHRSRSAMCRKCHGESVIHPLGGYGAVPGVLPSISRACIRMCEMPERGDPWRSQRCRSQTGTPTRAAQGKPALASSQFRLAADRSGEFVVSTSMPSEEVAAMRSTHWG
jgi:hypothetical protein